MVFLAGVLRPRKVEREASRASRESEVMKGDVDCDVEDSQRLLSLAREMRLTASSPPLFRARIPEFGVTGSDIHEYHQLTFINAQRETQNLLSLVSTEPSSMP